MTRRISLIVFFSAVFLWQHVAQAQTYCMPNSGTQTVYTHSGTFYDSGCLANNYSNNENGTIIFCPDTSCMLSADFFPVHTFAFADVLRIFGGNDTNSFFLGQMFGNPLGEIIFCSTDNASGCISFHFISNPDTTASGWRATIGCCSISYVNQIQTSFSSSLSQDINGNYSLNLNLLSPSTFTLNIFSADGKKISEKNYSLLSGQQQIPIITQNLSQGIYFCREEGENLNRSFKFIK